MYIVHIEVQRLLFFGEGIIQKQGGMEITKKDKWITGIVSGALAVAALFSMLMSEINACRESGIASVCGIYALTEIVEEGKEAELVSEVAPGAEKLLVIGKENTTIQIEGVTYIFEKQ